MLSILILSMIGFGDDWSWDSFAGRVDPPSISPAPTPDPVIIVRTAPFIPSVSSMPPNLPISAGWLKLTDDDGVDWFNKDSDSLVKWVQAINESIKRRKSSSVAPKSPSVNYYAGLPQPGATYTACGPNGCQTVTSYGYQIVNYGY